MNIGELWIALGFDIDDKKLKAFKEDIKDGLESLLKISAAGAAAVYAINSFVEGAIRTSTSLRDIRLETGLATDEMQRWANVISTTDPSSSFDQVLQTIHSIQDAITKSKLQGADPHAFAMLGIGNFQNMNATQVLEALRQRYQQNPEVFNDKNFLSLLYKDLGISNPASLISSFKLNNGQFDQKWNLPILTPEQIEKNVALGNSISTLTNRLEYLRGVWTADWSSSLEDAITKIIPLMQQFADYLKPVNDGLHYLGISDWDIIVAGIGSIALAFVAANPVAATLAATLAAIVVSLHDIGEYSKGNSGAISETLASFGIYDKKSQAQTKSVENYFGIKDQNWFLRALGGMESDLGNAAKNINQTNATTIHVNSNSDDPLGLANYIAEQQKNVNAIARQNLVPWGQ